MLDKEQIQAVFLFEFKMGHKAVETTHNINTLGPGTTNKHTVQWWFKKFFRDKHLEDEEHSGRLSEVDSGHLRGSSKLIILQLHEKWPKNSTLTILQSFGIWSKLGRWKIWISGASWTECKSKKPSFWNVTSYSMQQQQQQNLNWTVTCDEKWILYDNQQWPAQWLNWEGAPKHFSKSNLHSKKVMVTVWWSAASLTHYSFLKTGETITFEKCTQHIDEMHWKLPVLQKCNCKLH